MIEKRVEMGLIADTHLDALERLMRKWINETVDRHRPLAQYFQSVLRTLDRERQRRIEEDHSERAYHPLRYDLRELRTIPQEVIDDRVDRFERALGDRPFPGPVEHFLVDTVLEILRHTHSNDAHHVPGPRYLFWVPGHDSP